MVRNQVCAGCHMRLPIGTINTLMHETDIQLCDSCGRYLCLADEAIQPPQPAPAEMPASKPVKKARKRKATTNAG